MSNACHTLQFAVILADDLTIGNRPVKTNAFVVVMTGYPSSYDPKSYSTMMSDRDGGACRRWNESLSVDLPRSTSHVVVEVRRKGFFGIEVVGSANIPVSDFLGEGWGLQDHLHVLSYRLRGRNGVRNGIVNLSVRDMLPVAQAASSSQAMLEIPSSGGTVVAGIPVWFPKYSNCEFRSDWSRSRFRVRTIHSYVGISLDLVSLSLGAH
ncbi:hypothetical protein MLD38_036413 [Melastoma candidum]|uniref:Uncharacterized protein n=1 Tax=Melastoma candidum TaxID=119954 RepID=A0ACB9LK16_9MYRT|nr:hypothetical protein MLD38_036413 [Melastoma candidum]